MSKKNLYEVEFASMTWRTFEIEATSAEEAEEKAWASVNDDLDISKAWRENAEVVSIMRDNEDGSVFVEHQDEYSFK